MKRKGMTPQESLQYLEAETRKHRILRDSTEDVLTKIREQRTIKRLEENADLVKTVSDIDLKSASPTETETPETKRNEAGGDENE